MRQYGNSPTIQQLVKNLTIYFDGQGLLDEFYEKIWNIETANSYGLDVWGNIVGIGRYLATYSDEMRWGFNTSLQSFGTFNNNTFRNGTAETKMYRLSDTVYRKLIMTKAMSNIVRPNVPTLNNMLQFLFDGRRCYVLDLGGMRMRYVFCFKLENYEWSILYSEAMPRPAGVELEFREIPLPNVWGFHNEGDISLNYAPWSQGTYYNSDYNE